MLKLLSIFALVLLLCGTAQAFEINEIETNGAPEQRYDVVILGDGYTAERQEQLQSDAAASVANIFAQAPLSRYRALFNFSVVQVVSAEQGGDGGAFGAERDTALGAAFGGINGAEVDTAEVLRVAAEHVPEFDHAIVLIDDTVFGAVSGRRDTGITRLSRVAIQSLAHEMGHRWAQLGDEYETPTTNPPEPCDPVLDCPEKNLTVIPGTPRWAQWIADLDNVPTSGVLPLTEAGMFLGGRYGEPGVYRPRHDCKMRTASSRFCAVCSEQISLELWNLKDIRMIQSATPAAGTVELEPGLAVFELALMPLPTPAWEYSWTVDGLPVSGDLFLGVELKPGIHEVVATVRDATPTVRIDLDRMTDSVSWTVNVRAPADAGVAFVDAGEAPGPATDSGVTVPRVDAGATAPDAAALEDAGQVAIDAGNETVPVESSETTAATDEQTGTSEPTASETTVDETAPVDAQDAGKSASPIAPDAGTFPHVEGGGCDCRVGAPSRAPWLAILALALLSLRSGSPKRSRQHRRQWFRKSL